MKVKRHLMVEVLVAFCLTAIVFSAMPIRSQFTANDVGDYDPWADINDDGWVNAKDAIALGNAFSSSGAPLEKASITFDSGWMDISDKQGQNITITHGLGSNDVMVDITGKTTVDGGQHQRQLGMADYYIASGWNETDGGTSTDMARALVQTVDGGYALAGYTGSYGAGIYDFWLVKTDATGNALWNKTYGGTNYDHGYSLVQTVDGGYAIAGNTWSYGAGGGDSWLVKTDASGNQQWNKTYGGTSYDDAYDLVQTVDGGYALAGTTQSFGAGLTDFWLVKTDASGSQQWNKTYGRTNYDYAYALVQTVDGGYALAGSTYFAYQYDFWLVKTDASGNQQWNKTYGGTNNEWAYDMVQTDDGGYALAGNTYSYGAGMYDFWLVKTEVEVHSAYGFSWIDSTADTIVLIRGSADPYWNYVRVRVWQPKQTP